MSRPNADWWEIIALARASPAIATGATTCSAPSSPSFESASSCIDGDVCALAPRSFALLVRPARQVEHAATDADVVRVEWLSGPQ